MTNGRMKQWTWHHAVAFAITFFSYAFFHACRKAFSNVKDALAKSWSPSFDIYPYEIWQKEHLFNNFLDADVFLGELDTIFMFTYAFGLFIFGILGDRINLRLMLATGMIGSALFTFLFGYFSAVLRVNSLWLYRFIWALNGFFQSTGWPATVAIMGNWFSKKSGGLVFGFWSGNSSLGNIFGSLLVASVLHYGYEYGMLLNSLLIFCGGIVVVFCLIIHPNDVGLESPDKLNKNLENMCQDDRIDDILVKESKSISFMQALLIPGVIPYSLSYACLKLVSYTLFFWLPTYLQQGLHWDDAIADHLSNFYDIGGIMGGIFVGIVTDLMGYRAPLVGLTLLLSMPCLFIYQLLGTTYYVNIVLMILTGFLIGGPSSAISTTITADLGKHERISGNSKALSTVTGIIDGTGSIGAAIGQYAVAVINKHFGWSFVFYFLIIMAGLSMLCILNIVVDEMKEIISKMKNYKPLDQNFEMESP